MVAQYLNGSREPTSLKATSSLKLPLGPSTATVLFIPRTLYSSFFVISIIFENISSTYIGLSFVLFRISLILFSSISLASIGSSPCFLISAILFAISTLFSSRSRIVKSMSSIAPLIFSRLSNSVVSFEISRIILVSLALGNFLLREKKSFLKASLSFINSLKAINLFMNSSLSFSAFFWIR